MSEAKSLMEKSVTERNREYWNTEAKSYEDAHSAQTVLHQVGDDVLTRLKWIGVDWVKKDGLESIKKEVRMLDYACGPGNLARVLYPHVSKIRGVDVSEGMVEQFNNRAIAAGHSAEQMLAIQGDILADPSSQPAIATPEFFDLDLVTCSLAFHHFEDPELVAKKLVERLKPGKGVILIIDWLPDEVGLSGHRDGIAHGHVHEAGHNLGSADNNGRHGHGKLADAAHPSEKTIIHQGFSKERMEELLRGVGCVDVEYIVSENDFIMPEWFGGLKKRSFMVRGTRAG